MSKNIYITNCRNKDEKVADNDFYATHPESVNLFLNRCNELNIHIPQKIWEPCCGQGHISKVLEKRGYIVSSSDLYNYGYGVPYVDFLNCKNTANIDIPCIFTNPPYNLATEFVEHSLNVVNQRSGIVVMFLKLTFLECKKRQKLFQQHKLKYVLVHVNRQGCGKNGGEFKNGGAVAYAWYIWDNSFNGNPVIDWI